jgi:hypothetical protein
MGVGDVPERRRLHRLRVNSPLISLVLALALSGCATSKQSDSYMAYQGYYPPKRYDYPFKGVTIVRNVSADTARQHCPNYGVACVVDVSDNGCTIVFNMDYEAEREKILRHENGHCNGWNADHSN